MKNISIVLILFFYFNSFSQVAYTWNGTTSTDWGTNTNWTPIGLPGSGDNVTIVTGANNCIIAANTTVNNITMNSGLLNIGAFTFSVNGNTSLVAGTVAATSGTLFCSGLSTSFGAVAGGPTINPILIVNSASILTRRTIFNNPVTFTKNSGTTSNPSPGGNTFNSTFNLNYISTVGTGYISMGFGSSDIYNGDVTLNNNSLDRIILCHNSNANQFNGNVQLNQIGASLGTSLSWDLNSGATLASGRVITANTFNTGYLFFQGITQAGTSPLNIALTGTARLYMGNGSSNNTNNIFNGPITLTAPEIWASGSTYNGNVIFNKTGANPSHNSGKLNTFNGTVEINNTSAGYFMLGFNSNDVFNGDITVASSGTGGIRLGHSSGTGNPTLASGKTVNIGSSGFSAGNLFLGAFTQLGSTPINLNFTGNADIIISAITGTPCVFGGSLSFTASNIYVQGGTFNNPVVFTKTGGIDNHNNGVQNIFNSTLQINQQSTTGYFMLGYNSNDLFNDDITVTNIGTKGINLGWSSGTGTPTLANGKTISIGAAGFTGGSLYFGGFTQLGNVPINLPLTGAPTSITFKASNFGGNLTSVSSNLLINSTVFNGTTNFTKNGIGNDVSTGGNIFTGISEITNSGDGYFYLGNGASDQFLSNATFNNIGSANSRIYIANSHSLQTTTFAGNVILNANKTSSSDGWSYLIAEGASTSVEFNGNLTLNIDGVLQSNFRILQGANANALYNGNVTVNNINAHSSTAIQMGVTGNSIYNGNITIQNTLGGTASGVFFNVGATASSTLAANKTISIGAGGFVSGDLSLLRFTQLSATPQNLIRTSGNARLILGPTSRFDGDVNFNFPQVLLNGATYNGLATIEKNSSVNNDGIGDNIFNGTTNITNSGSGYLLLGNSLPDIFNNDVTFTNNGSATILPAWKSADNQFNGNITVNSTGSSLGINFCGGSAIATVSLAATKTISTGTYDKGYLILQRFTQLGNAAVNLNLTTSASYLQFGPNSNIGGNLTSTSTNLILNSTVFNSTSDFTITGVSNQYCPGGNTFNGASSITHNGTGFFLLGNVLPDTWNSDVTFTNNSNDRILPAWATIGNLFNGNIYVNTSGTAAGVQFCGGNATATATLAATKTIESGALGLNAGYLILKQFTQLGNAAINLNLAAGTSYLQFGPNSNIGGNVTSVSPRVLFNGCTFNGTTNCTKNGAVDDASIGNNIFNNNTVMTNSGSGYLMFGNGNPDQFNSAATFNNLGTNHIYIAHNSLNNIFGGVVTLNNSPSSGNNGIYASSSSKGTIFNDNIIVTSTNGAGVQFCAGNTTATSTLVAGKTITIGAAGFNSGTLLLKQFTQLGTTSQNFTTTGTSSIIQYGPLSSFGGNVTSVSPRLYFNGCTFNGTTNCTKNGAVDDQSVGNNTFNDITTITNSGSGQLMFGNGNPDKFNSKTTFNNTGSNSIFVAYNSANNIFGGETTFNNAPSANTGIYVSSLSAGTLFNDNIIVTSINGAGVQFCASNTTATSTLVTGKTISIGAAGFSKGTLLLKQFTQLGSTVQTLNITSGNALLQLGPASSFDGNVNFNFPQVLLNGTTYNGLATIQKNGATDNAGIGGNIFNGTTVINNIGSGYLMTGNGTADAFNGVTTFNNTGSYRIYFAHNHSGQTTTFAQATTLNVNKSGGADQWAYLIAESANSNLRFDGDLTINAAGTIRSDFRILQGATTNATYNGNVTINLTNTNSSTQINLGTVGTSNYNGNITLVNTGAGTASGVFFNTGAAASSTLAATKTIGLGAGGFTGGTLSMIRFSQIGATAQTLSQTTGTGILISGPTSTFDGDVNFNFPQIFLNGATYNGLATIEKNGATNNDEIGGNIFNGTTVITNSSVNYLRLANTTADAYNGDVTFVQNNSGVLAPNYNTNCNYGGNVTVSSSTTNTITFGSGTGIATFNGNNAQTINKTGSVANPVFTRLAMNKTSNDVTLNTRVNVSTLLTLTQGIIKTTSTNILNMNNLASTTIGNSMSYISGPMNYDMAFSGARALNFPIGKQSDWRPVTLNAVNNIATPFTYKGEVTNANANSLGYTKPATIDTVSHVHYWDIDRSLTSSGVSSNANVSGNQTILIYYGANDGVTDPSKLTIVKNTSAAPTSWIDIGGAGASMTAGSVSSTSSPSAFNSFSRFTLGNRISGTNPLPIELVEFTSVKNDQQVDLTWVTATEINNSHFEIERSADGINFDYLLTVKANGNGNNYMQQTYNTVDKKPYAGISYYRLKQVDKDGKYNYSTINQVEFYGAATIDVYPNPFKDVVNIKVNGANKISCKVYNSIGELVMEMVNLPMGNYPIDFTGFANGIYNFVIENNGSFETKKVILLK